MTFIDPIPSFPDELKRSERWLVRDEFKKPYNPLTKDLGNKDADCSNFVSAVAALSDPRFAGLGYRIVYKDGYTGIDFDHCVDPHTKVIDARVAEIISNVDSYAEFSPSGTGVRMFTKGWQLPPDRQGRKVGQAEMYSGRRYLTVTGNQIPGTRNTVEARDLSWLLDRIVSGEFKVSKKKASTNNSNGSVFVRTKQQYSVAIRRDILLSGQITTLKNPFTIEDSQGRSLTYPSQSEADLALCSMLVRDGKSAEEIDDILRGSSLMRPKWETQDYRDRTIKKAEEVAGSGVGDADEQHLVRVNRTETGNATRFANKYADKLRYSFKDDTWYFWNEHAWIEDNNDCQVFELMKAIPKDIADEVRGISDEESQQAHYGWSLRSESRSVISNSIFLSRSADGIPIDLEELDSAATDYKFNIANLTLDLVGNVTYPPRREDYITKMSEVVYDQSAQCPKFLAFLEQILPDPELRAYLQRAFGLCLTGNASEHAMWIFYGTGRNGKNTLLDVIRHILGVYAVQSNWSTFTEHRNDPDGGAATPHLACLRGARMVTASESKENAKLAEGVIKNVTGDDCMQVRKLHSNPFWMTPKFKLFLATNHKPVITGTDPAIWSRVNLINFNVYIPEDQRDPELPIKLRAEASGILNWMLEGYLAWRQMGLKPPASVKASTEMFRLESDILARFIDEVCDISPKASEKSSELYQKYTGWLENSGEFNKLSSQKFKDALEKKGFHHVKTETGNRWVGICFKRNTISTNVIVNNKPVPSVELDCETEELLPF